MKKKTLLALIHINFITGFFYAFYHFIFTPRAELIARRMWAYECWIIIGFYTLFLFLVLREKQKDDKVISLPRIRRRKK